MTKSLINPMDFTINELDEIFNLSNEIISHPEKFSKVCEGKILATLFFEASTRTRFSFEAAMMRLGGKILGFSEANSTSTSKGETLADTIRMVSIYSDIIAIRHPIEGSAKVASLYSSVPVINAGDGAHQHPTQTLTDLLTIKNTKEKLDGHTIGICGDLKYGRTVASLITAMARYKNTKFILISPKELKIPEYIRTILLKANIEFMEVESLEKVIDKLDVLYMTRVQKERFLNIDDYLKLKDTYILDEEKMKKAKSDMIVMHPLPRVNEISVEVDNDERALYFKQAEYGMYVRMALIIKLLENKESNYIIKKTDKLINENLICKNNKCITQIENNIPKLYKEVEDIYYCGYCDNIFS